MFAPHLSSKSGKVLDRIGSMQESMTSSARRIAEFVLTQPEPIIQCSIAELSQHIGVGEATIIRFCRTLGFKGFQEFKMELAIELSSLQQEDQSILDKDITVDDNAELIGKKLKNTLSKVLTETLNLIDFEQINTVTQLMKTANSVYFFGVGSSGITAEDAKHKFMRIGLSVDALTNNHFMYMKASILKTGDLAIGISHSGTSVETIKALQLAQAAGATTVALTHNPKSAICQHAHWVLLNGNRQGRLQGDSIGTKIAQLFVLDVIYSLLVKDDIDGRQNIKLTTTKALDF